MDLVVRLASVCSMFLDLRARVGWDCATEASIFPSVGRTRARHRSAFFRGHAEG
jgi:hypothetical protein